MRRAMRWPAGYRAARPRHLTTAADSPEAWAKALAADPEKLEAFVSALPSEQKKIVGLRWAVRASPCSNSLNLAIAADHPPTLERAARRWPNWRTNLPRPTMTETAT